MSSTSPQSLRYERRRHLRVRVFNGQLRLRLQGLEGWTARVVDISEGGLGCVFRANDAFTEPLEYTLQPNDPIEIVLDRGPRERDLTVRAEVRAMTKRDDEPHAWTVGLRFTVSGDEAARNVQSALLRLAMIRLRNSLGAPGSGVLPAASESGRMAAIRPRRKLGEILLGRGLISEEVLNHALAEPPGMPLGQRLVKSGRVEGEALAQALALQAGVEYFDLRDFPAERAPGHLLPDAYRRRWRLAPVESNRRMVHLVCANLPDPSTQRLIEERCGRRVKYSIGNEARIEELLERLAQRESLRLPASSGMSFLQPVSHAPSDDGRTEAMKEMVTSRGSHLRENRPAAIYQFRSAGGTNLHSDPLPGRLKTCDGHSLRVVGPVWDDRLLPADILTASPLAHVELRDDTKSGESVTLVGRPTQITHVVGAFFLIEFLIVKMSAADHARYQRLLEQR
ncbi:MAG: PilZ domain-containing protein [Planctomycetota bacterium]